MIDWTTMIGVSFSPKPWPESVYTIMGFKGTDVRLTCTTEHSDLVADIFIPTSTLDEAFIAKYYTFHREFYLRLFNQQLNEHNQRNPSRRRTSKVYKRSA